MSPIFNHHQLQMDKNNNHIQYLQEIHHFIFLQVVISFYSRLYGDIYGVLFNDGQKNMPLYDSVNFIFVVLELLLLNIPH